MNVFKLFISLVLFILSNVLFAQGVFQLTSQHADCNQAIDITGLDSLHASAPQGSGQRVEIYSSKTSLYAFKTEHNTVWYRFEVLKSCQLSFTIKPDNAKDDYDFLLYRARENQTCQYIRKGELKPVRSNISRPDASGETGLSSKGTSYYVHEGKGNKWSKPITVKRGEVYYLVLDNVYDHGQGQSVYFYYKDCKKEAIIEKKWTLNVNVKDSEVNRLIRGHVLLIDQSKGYKNYDTIYNKESSSIFLGVEPERYYECIAWADGYLKARKVFRLDSGDKTLRLDMNLQKVAVGKTFELGNLYFEGGTANVVRKSYPVLRNLLAIMKDNPSLEIEIQGHVNLDPNPKKKMPEEYYQELSLKRAQTVYDYLVKRGVAEKRMKYTGFGYSKMIYAKPKTSQQMQRNRRVVIKITDI